VFDLPPAAGLRRIAGRRLDAFERETLAFHRRVRRGYREIQRAEPKRVRLIDAGRPEDEVAAQVERLVQEALRDA
jgi:dTMP kinase